MARGFTVWFTGLSGAGKSTITAALVEEFRRRGVGHEVLDGDVVRTHLSKGLGFSKEDRDTNIRRIGWVAATLTKHGVGVICAAILWPCPGAVEMRHSGRLMMSGAANAFTSRMLRQSTRDSAASIKVRSP